VVFIIEDEAHAEFQDGEFQSEQDAMTELHRRAQLPWDQTPNVAPCTSWRTCGRRYVLVECVKSPWKELLRRPILDISAEGVTWHN
jgi:hypothetical protein